MAIYFSQNQNHGLSRMTLGNSLALHRSAANPGGGGWRSVLSWTAGTWLEVAELGSSDQRSNEG